MPLKSRTLSILVDRLYRKSIALAHALELNIWMLATGWVFAAAIACGLRMAFPATPLMTGPWALMMAATPYALIVAAPVLALSLGLHLFPANRVMAQPSLRLSLYGRWKAVDCVSARSHSAYGTAGIMASLLVGLILNVPVRAVEFLLAVPALGSFAPTWFGLLFWAMLADLVVLSSLYMFAFAMALRKAPLFPRFLVMVWGLDIVSQMMVPYLVLGQHVPTAVSNALLPLLEGNIKKVLISATLWLPYLILSDRVNLTYRGRVAA